MISNSHSYSDSSVAPLLDPSTPGSQRGVHVTLFQSCLGYSLVGRFGGLSGHFYCLSRQSALADITYIRLRAEFVYLAVILDGFSRKVVGWALERTLATRLTKAALEQAIAERQPPPGWVHHSDRGVQYASDEYGRVLQNTR